MNYSIESNFSIYFYLLSSINFRDDMIKKTLFSALYGLIIAFVVVFNLIIIMIYTQKRGLKHYTKYFFINLSVSDMMVLSICIPRTICDLFTDGEWKLGYLYCKNLNTK